MSMDVFKRVFIEVVTSEEVQTPEGIESMLANLRWDGSSDTAIVRMVVVADEPSLEQIVFSAKDLFPIPQTLEYRRGRSYPRAIEQACEDMGMPSLDPGPPPSAPVGSTILEAPAVPAGV
jgi:hypothetical protein